MSTSRAEFITHLSRALGRAAPQPPATPAPSADPAIIRTAGPRPDLAHLFAARAAEAGMTIHRATPANIDELVIDLLRTLNIRRIAIAETPQLAALRDRLTGRETAVECVDWRAGPGVEPLYSADAGLSDVLAAIAETGTLICEASPGHGRGLSLVPPVHTAVVRTEQILPDLVDFFTARRPGSSSFALITGPSKTADIEGILITGVHGPRAVHIILVDDR